MFNQPTGKKKKLQQLRPQFNPGLQQTRPMPGPGLQQTRPVAGTGAPVPSAPINGGSTAEVTFDNNGMTGVTRPKPIPFSPASARTVEMNDPALPGNPKLGQGNIVPRKQLKRGFKGHPLM